MPVIEREPAIEPDIWGESRAPRANHFRLQNSLLFERIPLTAEVTVCVRGGSAPRLPVLYRFFFSALRDSQWGSGQKECAGEEALYR
jgi:hypothetical protein